MVAKKYLKGGFVAEYQAREDFKVTIQRRKWSFRSNTAIYLSVRGFF